jgi:hypothetical protein
MVVAEVSGPLAIIKKMGFAEVKSSSSTGSSNSITACKLSSG